MNTILQFLCNTTCLADYFKQNYYKDGVNRSTPLGQKYKVAEEFGKIFNVL